MNPILGLLYLLLAPQDGLVGMSLPADFMAFSADSPWNTPIGDDPKVDAFSTEMMQRLEQNAGNLTYGHRKWSIPLFVIDASKSPRLDIPSGREDLYHTVDPDGNQIAEQMPMPDGVWPDPERDGHLLLIDPKQRRSWDYSRLSKSADGHWLASRIDSWDLDGPGFRDPFSGDAWWTSGARGSGFPLIAGLVRPEQIEAGVINHALVFACPDIRVSPYDPDELQLCPPASRTDGRALGFTYLPMGVRLQLDPELDLDRMGLNPHTKVVAKALQVYGMFLGDGASTFRLYFQNLGPGGGAWKRFGRFNLNRIPVSSFRVLSCDYVLHKKP